MHSTSKKPASKKKKIVRKLKAKPKSPSSVKNLTFAKVSQITLKREEGKRVKTEES